MNKAEAYKFCTLIASLWPSFQIVDRITAEMWGMIFNDVPFSIMEQALATYARTDQGSYAPSPQQISRLIQESENAAGSTANKAWEYLQKIRKLPRYRWPGGVSGQYQLVTIRDTGDLTIKIPEIIKETVEACGGWTKLAQLDDSQESFYRQHFLKVYEEKLRIKKSKEVVQSLTEYKKQKRIA